MDLNKVLYKIQRFLLHPRNYYIYPILVIITKSKIQKKTSLHENLFDIFMTSFILVSFQQIGHLEQHPTQYMLYASILLPFISKLFQFKLNYQLNIYRHKFLETRTQFRIRIFNTFQKIILIFIFGATIAALRFTYAQYGPIRKENLFMMLTQFEGEQNLGEKSTIIVQLLWENLGPVLIITSVIIYFWYKYFPIRISFIDNKFKIKFAIIFDLRHVLLLYLISLLVISYRIYEPENVSKSTFFENNYIFPDYVVEFPEKKRNMILFILESVENTYGSKKHGGIFEESQIPHLEEMALDPNNVQFTHEEGQLGGVTSLSPTSYSSGSLFAMLCGSSTGNPPYFDRSYREYMFYPRMKCLGDLTKENGYINTAMWGAFFGDFHKGYVLTAHGFNRSNVYNKREIDPKSKRWAEDRKVIEFMKSHLTNLSKQDKPFFLVYTTVDTHAPGMRCQMCNKSKHALLDTNNCNDKQVYNFVKWLKQQPFYENTTVYFVADHNVMNGYITMLADKNDFGSKRRSLHFIMNSVIKPNSLIRPKFTAFDVFPTLLAASGAKIKGNRVALGANLFSDQKSILEKFDFDTLNWETNSKSEWYTVNVLKSNKIDGIQIVFENATFYENVTQM